MIRYENIYVVPSYHGRLNFAYEVRKVFAEIKPDAVAVELPETIKENVILGIKRLPKISLVISKDEFHDRYIYVPIDPADSIIEGIRLSLENNISCYFIDLNVPAYVPKQRSLPDDESIKGIGLDVFYDTVKDIKPEYFNLDVEKFDGFPHDFINIEIKSINENELIDKNSDKSTDKNWEHLNPEEEKNQENFNDITIENNLDSIDNARDYFMACNLKSLMESHDKILLIVGLAHWERIKLYLLKNNLNFDVLNYSPIIDSNLANVNSKNISYILNEIPYFVYQWELYRQDHPLIGDNSKIPLEDFDKANFIQTILYRAKLEYVKRYQENLSFQKSKQLLQYIRNLVLYDKMLIPDIYHLVAAAKNIVNDDFAWFVYKTAIYYPYAVNEDKKVPTILISDNKMKMNGKTFLFRRRYPLFHMNKEINIREGNEEESDSDWRKIWDKNAYDICSYPEEDKILEKQYAYMRNVGRRIVMEKLIKTHKFNGNIMDGVDIRETIRNWFRGSSIYVKEIEWTEQLITNIIVIFNDEPQSHRFQPRNKRYLQKYPFQISFFAEHDHESDLAFFSTTPGSKLIGPGISMIKLGGFSAEYPPLSIESEYNDLFDTHYNRLFGLTYMKSERLLLNSIFQTRGTYIVYIAEKPPRKYFFKRAKEFKRKIIYIPINLFSNLTISKVKYIHILAGQKFRKYAKQYIDLRKRFEI